MEKIKVLVNYRCPLYPDHTDEVFYKSKILGKPICEGCSIDLWSLVEESERLDDILLDKLEKITGHTFIEYKLLGLEELLEEFERKLKPENIKEEANHEMEITKRSYDEVVTHWTNMVKYYKNEINKIKNK